jgi:hypothetical protein
LKIKEHYKYENLCFDTRLIFATNTGPRGAF